MGKPKAPAQLVWVDETEEVCLNCQYFRQYFMVGKGIGKFAHVPLNKGWCQFHRNEQSATRPPCTYRRMRYEE